MKITLRVNEDLLDKIIEYLRRTGRRDLAAELVDCHILGGPTMNKLMPCPFSGSEARIVCDKPYRDSGPTSCPVVACSNCRAAMGYFRDNAEAAEAWNRRKEAADE